ncbi:MAG TPA: right-handed parallel beta-helix repeat-containing protein, partial [Thermoanaerobaculia bacterium]|nr:right-handed parallel beta-helix repeat-containing protein [Thermoanaerobaculia bacterium]
ECAAGDHFSIDTIAFSIPGAGSHVLLFALGSPLPHITESVLIDGLTQPGSSANSNAYPLALNAVLNIELNLLNGQSLIIDGNAVIIRGLALNNATNQAIQINADDAIVVGCYIGTHADGSSAAGTTPAFGIRVNGTRHRTDIGYSGGPLTPDRNLITNYALAGILSTGGAAGNGSPDMNIIGNFVGTDASGTVSLVPAGGLGAIGMEIANAVVNSNLVSGNGGVGIEVVSPGNTVIQGLCGIADSENRIGVQRDGVTPLPNAGGGVLFHGGNSVLGGGPCTGEGNVIAYNTGTGVTVVPGVAGVRITQNSIHHNTTGGISLTGTTTPLANDACDADTAPGNHGQNYPVFTTVNVSSGLATAIGTIEGKANTSYSIELFSSAACSASGHGEGQAFIGRTSVTTDATCTTNFVIFSSAVPPGHTVFTVLASDTSTDPAHWDTSEFSACFPPSIPGATFYTVTPCRVADTRNAPGPYGGPALAAKTDRTFVVGGVCGISPTAKAVSFNFTITAPTNAGDLRVFPAGGGLPLVSTLNWSAGQTRANNAIIALGPSADLTVHPDQAAGTVHLIIDVNGYFQ